MEKARIEAALKNMSVIIEGHRGTKREHIQLESDFQLIQSLIFPPAAEQPPVESAGASPAPEAPPSV